MRNVRLFALLLPALLLPAACEDDGSTGSNGFTPPPPTPFEAGTTPMPEGGPIPDAGPDADAFVPAKGVTVTVLDVTTPVKNVRVLSHDAAGAVIGDVKTDALGKVVLAMAPSMVTVLAEVDSEGPVPLPLTYLGVADGDSLLVNVSDLLPNATALGEYNVSFAAPFAGATEYFVRVGGCQSSTLDPSQPLPFDLSSDCLGGPQAAVLASASDLAFGFVKNVAKPPLVAVPVDIGPISFTARGTTMLTATNLPVSRQDTSGSLYAIANGAAFYTSTISGTLDTNDLVFATATGFADAYQVTGTTANYPGGRRNEQTLVRREATTAPATATLNLDFATALPGVNNVVANNATVGRPTFTLTSTAPLSVLDGALVHVSFQNLDWRFVIPPATTTFKVPALPADAGTFLPTNLGSAIEAYFVESSFVSGYAAFKKLPVTPSGLSMLDASVPLPAAGTVRILRWDPSD